MLRDLVFGFVLLASALTAQKTWIVDAAGGAGHHYKELEKAITAAAAGDVILVRKGFYYLPEFLKKPLTIQGLDGPRVILNCKIGRYGELPLTITGIPKGQSVVLQNAIVRYSTVPSSRTVLRGAVTVTKNAGSVVFDDIGFFYQPWGQIQTLAAVRAIESRVYLRECRGSAVVAEKSELHMERCEFVGLPIIDLSHGLYYRGSAALTTSDSTISLANTWLTGGTDNTYSTQHAAFPGIVSTRSWITLRGVGSRIVAGPSTRRSDPQTSAVWGDAFSDFLVEGKAQIRPVGRARDIVGFRSVTRRALPVLDSGSGVVLGQTWRYSLTSEPGAAFVLHFGVPGTAIALPHTEPFHLDPAFMLVLQHGKQSTTGTTAFATPVPNLPGLRGLVFAVQGHSVRQGVPDLTNMVVLNAR